MSRDAIRKATKDADDLETAALRVGADVAVPLDESIYDQEVSEEESEATALSEEELEDLDLDFDAVRAAVDSDTGSEQLISAAGEIIQARQELLSQAYPFRLKDNSLIYIGSRTLVYELCLAIVNADVRYQKHKYLQITFERLAGIVMSTILGPGSTFLRTGHPPAEDMGRDIEPRGFHQAIESLNREMPGEWFLDANTRLQDPQDGGVDVVAWKKIDSREGSLIFVGNCGCGKNWLKDNKHRERPSSKLELQLSLPKPYHVYDFFSLPFHIHEHRDWYEARTEGRFILDRIRLALVTEGMTPDEWTAKKDLLHAPISDLITRADHRYQPLQRES